MRLRAMTMKIYLSGGMRSGWQNRVKNALGERHQYADPREKGETPEWTWREYGAWDFMHIDQCDLMLAYMERGNPSGYGLCAEVGYAAGKGIPVVLVIEPGHPQENYMNIVRSVANIVLDNLDDAIGLLQKTAW